jgi:aldehyde dehydrogenase (NAD+)
MENPLNHVSSYAAGRPVESPHRLEIRLPFDGRLVGSVELAGRSNAERAVAAALQSGAPRSRSERSAILDRARLALESRCDEFSRVITAGSGLCPRESRHEVGRASDVLRCAAREALRDDGRITFSRPW